MHYTRLLLGAFLTVANFAFAQARADPPTSEVQEKAFVVLGIHTTFAKALEAASDAAAVLSLHLDTRGLTPNAKTGLTFSRQECSSDDWEYPCYVPRGRYDDGVWLSIEFSSAYKGFTPGQFVIIAASGTPKDPLIPLALSRAREAYPEARLLTAPVYLGCIH